MHQVVYILKQNTMNGGRMGDFSLPRNFGIFATREAAVRTMHQHIRAYESDPDWTDPHDYSIHNAEVKS